MTLPEELLGTTRRAAREDATLEAVVCERFEEFADRLDLADEREDLKGPPTRLTYSPETGL